MVIICLHLITCLSSQSQWYKFQFPYLCFYKFPSTLKDIHSFGFTGTVNVNIGFHHSITSGGRYEQIARSGEIQKTDAKTCSKFSFSLNNEKVVNIINNCFKVQNFLRFFACISDVNERISLPFGCQMFQSKTANLPKFTRNVV